MAGSFSVSGKDSLFPVKTQKERPKPRQKRDFFRPAGLQCLDSGENKRTFAPYLSTNDNAQSRTHTNPHRKPHIGIRTIPRGRGTERSSAAQPLHLADRQGRRPERGVPLPRLRRPAGGHDRNAAAARRRGGLPARGGQDGPRGFPRLGTPRQGPLPPEPQPAGRHPGRAQLCRLPLRRQHHGPLRGHDQTQGLHQQRSDLGETPRGSFAARRLGKRDRLPRDRQQPPLGHDLPQPDLPSGGRRRPPDGLRPPHHRGQPHRRKPPAGRIRAGEGLGANAAPAGPRQRRISPPERRQRPGGGGAADADEQEGLQAFAGNAPEARRSRGR